MAILKSKQLIAFPFTGSAGISGSLSLAGSLQLDIAGKANGRVLTSDAQGNAYWQTVGASTAFPYVGAAEITGSLSISGSAGLNVQGGSVKVDGVNVLDTALAYAIALG